MKKLYALFFALIVLLASTIPCFAMASGNTGCHKTQSCFGVWQCYSSSISDCRKKVEDGGMKEGDNPMEYWKRVGECQAGFCPQ